MRRGAHSIYGSLLQNRRKGTADPHKGGKGQKERIWQEGNDRKKENDTD
jgi:hypothetical protein